MTFKVSSAPTDTAPHKSRFIECECIFFKLLCTWFLNNVNPILLVYDCPFANDLARLLTKLISTFGGTAVYASTQAKRCIVSELYGFYTQGRKPAENFTCSGFS
jgi:hypothetical protein